MKKLAILLVLIMCASFVFGCSQPQQPETSDPPAVQSAQPSQAAEPGDSNALTEADAWAMVQAGTLKSDPYTGYEYVEDVDQWYYSNYPNYKDFSADGRYKVAFVCKFSGAWFTPKNNACKKACEDFGYEYLFIDANSDKQAWLDGIQNIINQDFDAVILTPVNTTLMPEAVALLQEAGIAYMTTDDPGADGVGFYSPHYGLNDWWLHNEAAKIMCEDIKADNWFDGVAADYSNFLFVIEDAPAVEAIHNRNVGAYDAVKAAFPDIPEDRIMWLDCGNGLAEEHTEKFSNVLQANKDTTQYWIVSSGSGDGGFTSTMTLFKEAGVDIGRYVRMTECMSTDSSALMMQDDPEGCGKAGYGVGLMGYPSGIAMVTIFKNLFENGTPIPAFSPYALNIVKDDTVDDFLKLYYEVQAG